MGRFCVSYHLYTLRTLIAVDNLELCDSSKRFPFPAERAESAAGVTVHGGTIEL